jgi:hypothetical protein
MNDIYVTCLHCFKVFLEYPSPNVYSNGILWRRASNLIMEWKLLSTLGRVRNKEFADFEPENPKFPSVPKVEDLTIRKAWTTGLVDWLSK